MSTVRLRGPVQVVRPKFVRFFDLIRSVPDQARLALGTRGVVWATAAGMVGLVCCAVSMAAVALSLHATEAGRPIYERMGYAPIAAHTVFIEKKFLGGH